MQRQEQALLAANLDRVRERIARAARRSGRQPRDIKLVAVTKYVGTQVTCVFIEAGCRDLGESRPQQLWTKVEAFTGASVNWHLIGHLQRNKVPRTVRLIDLLHSLDSERLASVIREARPVGPPLPVLVEVNISGDATKHGVLPQDADKLLAALGTNPAVSVRGLMAMAGREGGKDRAKAEFARLRELRDRLQRYCPPQMSLAELSMGMSDDFEEAIAEGATIVRVGSLLFKGLSPELALKPCT